MEKIDGIAKMKRIMELNQQAEDDHVAELRSMNPQITDEEIKIEIRKWWNDKDEHWPEEFFRPISRERFERMTGRPATPEEIESMRLR